jgi:hypothetical protein
VGWRRVRDGGGVSAGRVVAPALGPAVGWSPAPLSVPASGSHGAADAVGAFEAPRILFHNCHEVQILAFSVDNSVLRVAPRAGESSKNRSEESSALPIHGGRLSPCATSSWRVAGCVKYFRMLILRINFKSFSKCWPTVDGSAVALPNPLLDGGARPPAHEPRRLAANPRRMAGTTRQVTDGPRLERDAPHLRLTGRDPRQLMATQLAGGSAS